MDAVAQEYVEHLVRTGKTHKQISEILLRQNPGKRGLSERSVRRYCEGKGISRRSYVDDAALDDLVSDCVSKVRKVTVYLCSMFRYSGVRCSRS